MGQERYQPIIDSHIRRATGALLVYDTRNENSFVTCKKWLKVLRDKADPDIIIMLVGIKLDILNDTEANRKISKEEAENFANNNNLLFRETSSFLGENGGEVFEGLLQNIFENKSQDLWNRQRQGLVEISDGNFDGTRDRGGRCL